MHDYQTFGEYRTSDRSNVGTVLTFLAIGIGIGSLVGLLMAPKTGKQMRKTLRRKYEDARDNFGDWSEQASDLLDKGSEWASTVREKVGPMASKMRRNAY